MYQSQFIEMFGKSSLTIEMQECFSMIRNGANIKQGQVEGGFPITRIETISDETIDRKKMGYAGIIDNKYESYYLQEGDILVSHINSLKHIGKCALYCKQEDEIIIHGMNLLCLRPIREIVVPTFAIHMLRSDIIKKQIADITKPAVNQASFSVRDFGGIKAIIPNIDEQNKFVAIAEQADKSKFSGLKSQFFEMFGDTHMRSDYSRQWKEVVKIINGKDYKSIQVEDGGYPVYGTGGEMARASDYLSPANSILLGRKGTIDKPLLIREKYWNVDTAFGVVPDEKVLHYVYFYWHCKTIDFNVLNKGTTLPSTTKVDLLNLWIKIPSMEEQTRFASIVEQADKSKQIAFSRAS